MPYKDPVISKQKARERKKVWQERQRQKRVLAGLPADGRGKHGNQVKGSEHSRWNEAIISSHGYVKVRVGRQHPLADPNGYAYEHLLIWCAAGNLKPKEGEVIHHLNGDKHDNRIENLKLLTAVEHSTLHNRAGCLLDGKEHKERP